MRASHLPLLAVARVALLSGAFISTSVASMAQTAGDPLSVVGDNATTQSDSDLAKQIQNPVGDLISLPIVNNVNLGYGPHRGTQNVVNLQPVIPFHVNDNWNIITRAILPIVWNPSLQPSPSVPLGTGPTSFTAFLAPQHDVDGWVWGAGPVVQAPTISSASLGSNVWGAGPSAVLVFSGGPWVAGALFNNIWSLGGSSRNSANSYSNFLANPFVSYNFDSGWYISSAPSITANWQYPGTKWTVPIGGGAGRFVHVGSLPIDLSVGTYYNIVRPTGSGRWQLSAQATLVF